jgi:hypothetical protein
MDGMKTAGAETAGRVADRLAADAVTDDVAELTKRLSANGPAEITEIERVVVPEERRTVDEALINSEYEVRPGTRLVPPEETLAFMASMQHQLHAARFAFHKLRCKVYGDAVQQGLLPLEEGRLRYTLAMHNYDELIKSSANGSVTEADQTDMDKGFLL